MAGLPPLVSLQPSAKAAKLQPEPRRPKIRIMSDDEDDEAEARNTALTDAIVSDTEPSVELPTARASTTASPAVPEPTVTRVASAAIVATPIGPPVTITYEAAILTSTPATWPELRGASANVISVFNCLVNSASSAHAMAPTICMLPTDSLKHMLLRAFWCQNDLAAPDTFEGKPSTSC